MTLTIALQPDQQPVLWDDYVTQYESVFEPLTTAFGCRAIDLLAVAPGSRIIDVGAGCGGLALEAQRRGIDVVAIDASVEMVKRIRLRACRAGSDGVRITANVMDGRALALPSGIFDAAISIFGVVLFPDAERGVREMARVVKPQGRIAVVTWTESDRYELAVRLMAAAAEVRGPQPPPKSLPAQLRYRERAAFCSLFESAGVEVQSITRIEERWTLPSAAWIAEHIVFAPGMSALVDGLGSDRDRVLQNFILALERDQGREEIVLSAVAHVGIGRSPSPSVCGDLCC
jgi:SAM-dependent methyltransferase